MNLFTRLRRAWQNQWGSQGIEAAGAALAAALIIGALLLAAPAVGERVQQALSCAASVLGGGGGSCGGGTAAAGGDIVPVGGTAPEGGTAPTTSQPAQPESDDCGFFCQAGGFFKGVGEGAVDFATGIGSLAVDGFNLITGDQATRDKYAQLGEAFVNDPLGTLGAVGSAIIEPVVTDWQAGRYGEAIGRGFFDIASTIVGDKGIGKLGKLGKVDDIARGANRVDNLPCVGSMAPGGRGPGLAAPLACPTTRGGAADAAGSGRGLWEITPQATSRVVVHPRFGTISQHASTGLWWSRDTAGHGGSAWKVFEETSTGLRWRADADRYGDFLTGKHKGPTGQFIPWSELRGR